MLSSSQPQSMTLHAWNEGIQLDDFVELTKKPENTTWHDIYTDTADELGYRGMSDGCCHGFASAGPVAFWISILGHSEDGLKSYFSRLCALLSARKMNALANLRPSGGMHCFFSRIKLIQQSQSSKTEELFDKPSYSAIQREEALEGIIKPKIIEDLIPENPWRIALYNQIGVYTLQELELYAQLMTKHLGTFPFELDIVSGDHRVSMCYCPTQQEWLLFDANTIPLCFFKATNTAALAKQLQKSLFGGDEYTIISTTIKSIPFFKNGISACIERLKCDSIWNAIHDITTEKALATDRFGFSALMVAAHYNNVQSVRALINAGANVNLVCSDTGTTALNISILKDECEDTTRILLAAGADPNHVLPDGFFPLYTAATNNSVNVARLLLDAGANLQQTHQANEKTALWAAIMRGHTEVADLLLTYKYKSEKVHSLSGEMDATVKRARLSI